LVHDKNEHLPKNKRIVMQMTRMSRKLFIMLQ
jgi:hypothetical protein